MTARENREESFDSLRGHPLAERIRQTLARRKNVDEKTMFGGMGFLLNGNVLVGVWKDSSSCGSTQTRVKAFDITWRAMKGGVLVGPEGIEDDGQVKD